MSTRDVAEQAALLCAGIIGLVSGAPPAGAAVAIPLVTLLAMGRDLRGRGVDRGFRTASAAALNALSASPDFTPPDLDRARGLLEGLSPEPRLRPGDLHAAAAEGADGFGRALAEHVMQAIPFEPDDAGAREAIRLAVEAGLAACRRDPNYRDGLTQALVIEVARAQGVALEVAERTDRGIQQILAKLEAGAGLARDELDDLAQDFGMSEPETLSPRELRGLLFEKAEDYRRLLTQVRALEEQDERIASLKLAAEQAVLELRLEDARRLIREAGAIQRAERTLPILKEQAALAETEAQIALLGGDVDEAYHVLTSSAASFGPFDRKEMLRRHWTAWQSLHQHGVRYGGGGLLRAIDLMRQVIANLNEREKGYDRAIMLSALGLSLRNQGERATGREALERLAEAADAHRAAATAFLTVGTPRNVAVEQNSLGGALRMQSECVDGEAKIRLLREAIAAYRTIPQTVSVSDEPAVCAGARMNLGAALQALSKAVSDPEGLEALEEARAAGREAVRAFEVLDIPEEWAKAQTVLGNTLAVSADRAQGEERRRLLEQALEAQEAPLRFYTREEHPLPWALAHMNLTTKLGQLGELTPGAEGLALVEKAKDAAAKALTIYTEDENQRFWAETMSNLGQVHEVMARHDTCSAPQVALEKAERCYTATLRVYDPVHAASEYQRAIKAVARVRTQLATLEN